MSVAVVILAAGKSTRFKSATPKVLHTFGERPMIVHTLELAQRLSDLLPVLVVGEETLDAMQALVGHQATLVLQRERLGTGHAVLQARPVLEGKADRVLVLYGDMPLLQQQTLQHLLDLHERSGAAMAMLTIVRDESQGFGRVLRDAEGNVLRVVEEPEATPEQLKIRELNAGIYVYDAEFLWSTLPEIRPSPVKGEIYLTDMVEAASRHQQRVVALILEDPTEAMGINTRVDFAAALRVLQRRINTRWMSAGVTLIDPETVYIGPDVVIGPDTTILPNTHLRGRTVIGAQCEIGPNTLIENSVVGDRCRVIASVVEKSEIEHDHVLGPFAHLQSGIHKDTSTHSDVSPENKD